MLDRVCLIYEHVSLLNINEDMCEYLSIVFLVYLFASSE